MKRAFYILFAFYFLSLAIIPCGDKDDCNELKHEQRASNDHHEHEDEACTPFCVCSCCATHIMLSQFNANIIAQDELLPEYTETAVSKLSSVAIPIWQPPKLV